MKISVIIPTYNRARLISETINSVLAQSFQDFEVIVIDDGSTDSTAQELASFGDQIQYLRQGNLGVNNARNHGLAAAQGEYIAMLDDDDLWHPDKLAVQVQIMDRFPELAFTFSNFWHYKSKDSIQPNGIQLWYDEDVDWEHIYEHFITLDEMTDGLPDSVPRSARLYFGQLFMASLNNYYVLPSTAVFRRSLVPPGLQFAEHDPICGDWEFFARLSREHTVGYLDFETTWNRSHDDDTRLTRTSWEKQLECRIDMLERLYFQDKDFYARHGKQVNSTYYSWAMALCRQQLLNSKPDSARKTLARIRSILPGIKLDYIAMLLASHTPGISPILRLARRLPH